MKISELSALTKLSASRIRFYERIGLLHTVSRQDNGYRVYPPEAVTVLKLITSAQQAGFSLDELRALLPSDLTSWDHALLLGALRRKLEDIDDLQRRLAANRLQLQALLQDIERKPEDIDCAANAQRLLNQFGLNDEPPLSGGR